MARSVTYGTHSDGGEGGAWAEGARAALPPGAVHVQAKIAAVDAVWPRSLGAETLEKNELARLMIQGGDGMDQVHALNRVHAGRTPARRRCMLQAAMLCGAPPHAKRTSTPCAGPCGPRGEHTAR